MFIKKIQDTVLKFKSQVSNYFTDGNKQKNNDYSEFMNGDYENENNHSTFLSTLRKIFFKIIYYILTEIKSIPLISIFLFFVNTFLIIALLVLLPPNPVQVVVILSLIGLLISNIIFNSVRTIYSLVWKITIDNSKTKTIFKIAGFTSFVIVAIILLKISNYLNPPSFVAIISTVTALYTIN